MRWMQAARFVSKGLYGKRGLGLWLAGLLCTLAPSSHAASEAISCVPGASTQTIGYGTVAACTIEFPANDESDVFQFPATDGDLIMLVLTRTGGGGTVCMVLEHPFGLDVAGPNCTSQSTRIDWTFSGGGTYHVDVYEYYGFQQVQYTLTLERIAPASPAAIGIGVGQARGSEINPAGDLDIYSFSGSPGQAVTVSVYRTGGSGTPCLESVTPDRMGAAPTACDSLVARSSFTVSSSGTYALVVYSQSHNSILQYSIQVVCTAGCPVQPPPDLTQCVNPRSLQTSALVGGELIRRFISVGSEELPNCSLPGVASFSASVTLLNGAGWLTVSPSSGTFFPGAPNTLRATVNPVAAGGAGTYQAVIQIAVPSLNVTLKIPLTLTLRSGPQLSLSWNAFAFQTVELTSAPPPQTMRIYNGVPGNIDWAISSADDAAMPFWLSVSPLSGTAGSAAGQGSRVVISVNPSGLTAGTTNNVYNALLKVTSPNASNSPQYVSVSFHVVRVTAAPVPLLTAYGIVFNATQGGTAPPAQSFQFSNTGGGVIMATISSNVPWLSLSSPTATTASGPQTLQAAVNPSGLTPGLYRGRITAKFDARNSTGATVARPDQTCDVVLNVAPAEPAAPLRGEGRAVTCTPTRMDLVGATIGNGVNVPVSFPQVLLTQVIDDCGQAVTGATAVSVADGLTIPLSEVGGGLYSGNWTPPKTNVSANISFSIFHPTFASVQQVFTVSAVTASGGTVLPTLFSQGVVEGAGFSQGRPLVPGGIISLFGSSLAPPGTLAFASTIPLERTLAQTKVRIGNVDAPLYFVSPGQINAQLPFEAVPGETVTVVLNVGGRLTVPQQYQISPAQPGIFKTATDAAVLDENSVLVTAQNPARIGKVIQIFAGGLGFTTPPVASGAGSPSFSTVQLPVSVTIGGIPATVDYQGLAPNYVGLYQVNVFVPPGVTPGEQVLLVITQNGIPSNPDLPVTLPVAP